MKKVLIIGFILGITVLSTAFLSDEDLQDLRSLYSKPIQDWPKPNIDSGVVYEEFKSLPKIDTSYFSLMEQPKVKLGKMLFFDPILSGSNQISCSTCHNPQTSFGDHSTVPVGHDHLVGDRNTISLLNVAARKSMFWDGRAHSLEEQALSPIEAHNEMAMDITKLVPKLKAIPGYTKLFKEAFGDDDFSMPEIMSALATFQRTLTSRRSRFDEFLDGKYDALNDDEIAGLHLFRTKARCMNCHNGQYFTDEDFHNIGLTYYKRKYEDLGRYKVTKDPKDVGKFRTPSLRDVLNTNPWMHNGLFDNIIGVINMYNSGMQMNNPRNAEQEADPMHPRIDPLMKKLDLTREEIRQVAAFLDAITATKYRMPRPENLPR
ncbi:cytochrome-c peroxidase [Sphingobacterium cellulitidis]|uniref:Methylamine utilization protein MauG n=1 Tax=Sphingobacterium cellulitidis TaxID=1768011 RepID=A0A8H9FXP1_9SPHI|nr:cytochrome c peroxidase [Sphingobacterium soli]MBA8985352.1 cytochrome c peroxidase [Sphingobacterium soli]GGE10349.1 methylamine utilization protein [Sphingobacterium soli]